MGRPNNPGQGLGLIDMVYGIPTTLMISSQPNTIKKITIETTFACKTS